MEESQVYDDHDGLPSKTAPGERPIVLITTVDIGGGRSDRIELRQGDSPEDAARAFCELHNIPSSVVAPLTEHILDNLRKANLSKLESANEHVGKIAAQLQQCLEEDEEEEEQEEEEDEEPARPAPEPYNMDVKSNLAGQKLTFADPSDKLYEQLSAKLLPVDDSSRLLSVSASLNQPLSGRNGPHSNRASSISMNSERGIRKSQSAETSPRVHNRLYQQAVDLRSKQEAKRRALAQDVAISMNMQRSSMSWISQEMMRDRSAGPFDNYGEMLYAEGLEAAAHRKAKAATIRAERAARELEGATFTPEITRLAAALWAGDDLDAQPAWQRLSANKRNKTLERIREMKGVREQMELKECTFKPRINRQSVAMMSERTLAQQMLNMTTHEQLFADAIRRQQKMEQLQSWLPEEATFAPAINKSSVTDAAIRRSLEALRAKAVKEGGDGSVDGRPSVVDRLYVSMERSKAKLDEKRALLHGDVDPATGTPLFRPTVGRAPRGPTARNREGMSIGDYLYVAGMESAGKKEAQLEAEKQVERENASKPHLTNMSVKLYDKLRAKRFAQIFEYLDVSSSGTLDLVGLVRTPTAHLDNLDNEVREDVEVAALIHAETCGVPLLPDHDPASGPMDPSAIALLPPAPAVDLSIFSQLMESSLTRRRKPRAYLVPSPSAKYMPSHTFQPAINKKSKELAARLRPPEFTTYEVLHHNAETVRSKLEAARREAEVVAMADCSFVPRLNPTMAGQPVEGRALRAARSAIAAASSARTNGSSAANSPVASTGNTSHMIGNGSLSAGQSPAGQSRHAPGARYGSTATSAVSAPQPKDGGASSVTSSPLPPHYAALEAEVHQVLQGVDLASARLGALERGGAVAPATPASAIPSSTDLRATEAMLLDLLTASPQSLDSAADTDVINQLHRFLVAEAQNAVPAAAAHVMPTGSARRGSKDAAGANAVNLFVVPAQGRQEQQWE